MLTSYLKVACLCVCESVCVCVCLSVSVCVSAEALAPKRLDRFQFFLRFEVQVVQGFASAF